MKVQSNEIIYILYGDPIPLARPRFANRKVYDSQKHLRLLVGIELQKQHINKKMFTGPLHLDAIFYLPIPECHKRKKLTMIGRPHIFRPDLSNLLKFTEDVATGILYSNDCIISSINCKKIYDDNPRTEFILRPI